MFRRFVFAISLAAFVALAASVGSAQQPMPAALPVIVVFHDYAEFGAFSGRFHPDERAAANPEAWDYLDRGIAGFVQELELRHDFRADHVYSHVIRGFAAPLTPAQIAAVGSDPNVNYIERDAIAHAIAQTLPWGIDKIEADITSTFAGNGSGEIINVNAYIIDTGIDVDHTDLNVIGSAREVDVGARLRHLLAAGASAAEGQLLQSPALVSSSRAIIAVRAFRGFD